MSHNNAKTLRDGLMKARTIMRKHLEQQLREICEHILLQVPRFREYKGFTGNTQTSYTCGIYVNGNLVKNGIVRQPNWNTRPLRRKINYGEWAWLAEPYDVNSEPRSVQGKVPITGLPLGAEESIRFLRSYHPASRIAIVMTTGTEYSEYLEEELGLDVLTNTFDYAARIYLKKAFKPIPNTG